MTCRLDCCINFTNLLTHFHTFSAFRLCSTRCIDISHESIWFVCRPVNSHQLHQRSCNNSTTRHLYSPKLSSLLWQHIKINWLPNWKSIRIRLQRVFAIRPDSTTTTGKVVAYFLHSLFLLRRFRWNRNVCVVQSIDLHFYLVFFFSPFSFDVVVRFCVLKAISILFRSSLFFLLSIDQIAPFNICSEYRASSVILSVMRIHVLSVLFRLATVQKTREKNNAYLLRAKSIWRSIVASIQIDCARLRCSPFVRTKFKCFSFLVFFVWPLDDRLRPTFDDEYINIFNDTDL